MKRAWREDESMPLMVARAFVSEHGEARWQPSAPLTLASRGRVAVGMGAVRSLAADYDGCIDGCSVGSKVGCFEGEILGCPDG